MTWIARILRNRTLDRQLDAELHDHIEREVADAVRSGESEAEARRRIRLQSGSLDQVKEACRDVRRPRPLANAWTDVRYATRILWKRPGFAALAILTLALGSGATTAIFSVVYGVLLKPLPFNDPDRLVALYHLVPGFGPGSHGPQGPATYFTYRDNGRVFEDIGLWQADDVSTLRAGEPERIHALRVTDGTLALLGVRPALGRLFQREDDVPAAPLRVMLTHGYWQGAFGGAPDVLGQSLVINARPHEVIGVLPASFKLLNNDPQVLLPMRINRANTFTGGFGPSGVARLKPGVTLEQANEDIARMIPLIVETFPLMPGVTREMWDGVGLAPNVEPLAEGVIGEVRRPLWILLGTVGIVLLIACTNVANLLLVRAEKRQGELAVRRALGASRGRIAAGLLFESLVLGLAGGTLGILFAQACIAVLRRMAPVALPRVDDIGIDGVVLAAVLTMSIVTSLLFGLIPALRCRTLSVSMLKESGRSTTDAPGRHRTRNTLVVAQVALALVLLVVSGLMARTFVAMRQVEPGFVRPDEVQTFGIALPPALVRDRQQVTLAYQEIAARLQQLPGVSAVGLANMIPMDGSMGGGPIFVEGRSVAGTPPLRRIKAIGPGYFDTLGTPLLAGRDIAWTDIHQPPPTPVVWVSENFAREFWGEPSEALGKRIGGVPGAWEEIVGVVGNVREAGMNQPAPTQLYSPLADQRIVSRDLLYIVRSDRVGTPGFIRELQQAVWSVNKNVPLANVKTLLDVQAESMSQTSFAMVMLAIGAGVALLLALVGIYGVVSFIVAERTGEIGIRMALGAQASDVRRLFLRHGLALTLTGIALGLGVAALVTPVMSSLLYGVAATDPVTYASVAIIVGAVALVATYLPAYRASRESPIVALRSGGV